MIFFCKIIFDFFLAEGHDIMFVTSTRIYRKYNIAMYFLRRIIFHFPSKEKISFFRGTKPSFQIIQEISYSRQIFLKRPSFQNIWRKYHISMYFVFWERSSFVFRPGSTIKFPGKINIIFPDNTRRIIFQRDFLERPSAQDVLKKKIWFCVQWKIYSVYKGLSCSVYSLS